jgi:hypothetical protein
MLTHQLLEQGTLTGNFLVDERRNVSFRCRPPRDIGVSYLHDLIRNKRLFPMLDSGYHIPSQICQQEYGADKFVRRRVKSTLLVSVAILAAGAGFILAMALDAAFHRSDFGYFCHDAHLTD